MQRCTLVFCFLHSQNRIDRDRKEAGWKSWHDKWRRGKEQGGSAREVKPTFRYEAQLYCLLFKMWGPLPSAEVHLATLECIKGILCSQKLL